MTQLSVNINKVALLRNSRHLPYPDPQEAARIVLKAGAKGITVHPRPDQRHIRPDDVKRLADLLEEHPDVEFNMEGNPFEGDFMDMIARFTPHQCTLVPDHPEVFTSDSGWKIEGREEELKSIIATIKKHAGRVSLFMDADSREMELVRYCGADRIEIYTEPYAASFGSKENAQILDQCIDIAKQAAKLGLGVNAGHDLNLNNLGHFLKQVPYVHEVSIGHALIADALFYGLEPTVKKYLAITGA